MASVPLSIFAACYLTVVFTCLLAVKTEPGMTLPSVLWFDDLLCNLIIWSSGSGLTIPLILATLIVKMLRIYCFFTHYKSKVSKTQKCNLSPDLALTFYVILILLPNVRLYSSSLDVHC